MLEERIKELENKVKESQRFYVELQEAKRGIKKLQESENALIEENHALLDTLHNEKKKLIDHIKQLQEKCREVEQITKKNEEIRFSQRIHELEEDNLRLRRKLEEQLLSDNKENSMLKGEILKFQERSKAAKQQNFALEEQIRALEREYQESLGQIQRMSAIIEEMNSSTPPPRKSRRRSIPEEENQSELEPRSRSPPNRRAISPSKIEGFWSQIRGLNAEVETLQLENQELLAYNAALEQQLEESRYMSTKADSFLEKRVSVLQNEAEFWKSKCDQLTNKYYGFIRKLREEKEEIKVTTQTQLVALREAMQVKIDDLRRGYNKHINALGEKSVRFETREDPYEDRRHISNRSFTSRGTNRR